VLSILEWSSQTTDPIPTANDEIAPAKSRMTDCASTDAFAMSSVVAESGAVTLKAPNVSAAHKAAVARRPTSERSDANKRGQSRRSDLPSATSSSAPSVAAAPMAEMMPDFGRAFHRVVVWHRRPMRGGAPQHRRRVLSKLQQVVAHIVTDLLEAEGFALAGGAGLVMRRVVDRQTRDLDYFGPSADDVDRLTPVVESELNAAGFTVRRESASLGFARLSVAAGDEGHRARSRRPRAYPVGR
jgi:hypothetical protein